MSSEREPTYAKARLASEASFPSTPARIVMLDWYETCAPLLRLGQIRQLGSALPNCRSAIVAVLPCEGWVC